MKNFNKQSYIGIILLLLFLNSCQRNSFVDGPVPTRNTELEPEPVDTLVVPDAYKAFLGQVKMYEEADKETPIQIGEVLLLGNSLFTNWKNAQEYYDEDVIYNRSIDNILIDALQFYTSRLVLPYNPRQILLYIGENELQSGKTVTATFNLIKVLIEGLQYNLPTTEITYLSLLKTPNNTTYHTAYDQLNAMIKNFLEGKNRLSYIDINASYLTGGIIDAQYFNGNNLNTEGIEKLANVIKTKLDSEKPKVSTFFDLDGSTYISIPHADEFNIASGTSKTFTLWLKPIAGAGGRVINKRMGTTYGYELVLNAALTMAANIRNSANANAGTPNSTGILLADQWNHLTLMYDQTGLSKKCKIYLNGNLLVESAAAMTFSTDQTIESTSELLFGTLAAKNAFLRGSIDNIRVYDKALTLQEIVEDMNTLKLTDYTNLIAEYDFEDISGNQIKNKVSDQYHGTVVGNVKTNQRIVQ